MCIEQGKYGCYAPAIFNGRAYSSTADRTYVLMYEKWFLFNIFWKISV